MALRSVCFGVRSSDGRSKIYYLELLRASECTLSRWSRLSLTPTNPHWARVVGYGPFFFNKEGLCPSNGDINRL
jgi:hypothetical protein